MSKKIHLVVTYFNRKRLFLHTLKTLQEYSKEQYNLNVIVVDDGSSPDHRLEGIVNNYNFNIKIIYIDTNIKTWVNPCVTYNIGFFNIEPESEDDIVIIQNPETCHMGDILGHAFNNLTHKDYFVYHCLAFDDNQTNTLIAQESAPEDITSITEGGIYAGDQVGAQWYVHKDHNPRYFHFCSSLTYKNLKLLNGFDMRYASGDAFDDDELAYRIKNSKLTRKFIPNPFVVHLWHKAYEPKEWSNWYRNRDFFKKVTKTEKNVTVNKDKFGISSDFSKISLLTSTHADNDNNWRLKNVPKIANFYWGSNKMSYLRYLTIISFIKFNPDWEVRLYVPKIITKDVYWRTDGDTRHMYDEVDYTSEESYFSSLPESVKIIPCSFSLSSITDRANEVHKSDLLGWQILSTKGGLWCDMDILFFKSINTLSFDNFNCDTVLCPEHRHLKRINNKRTPAYPIGFLLSSPNNLFFKSVLRSLNYNKSKYQSIGADALRKYIAKNNIDRVCNIDYNSVYKYDYNHLSELFTQNNFKQLLATNNCIGTHWYGGSGPGSEYNNLVNHKNYKTLPSCTITEIIKYLNLHE